MLVPIINKQYEKDKLMDLINSCGLTKTEIAKKTKNPPDGYGKVSIQTMYDLEFNKPENKPDQLKVFQIKEILRVITLNQGKEISLSNFLNPDISKVRVVLEWNFRKARYESPNLFNSQAKAVYFPQWINQNPNLKAVITYPKTTNDVNFAQDEWYKDHANERLHFRKDARVSLFDTKNNDWNNNKKENLLWRPCLVKVKDKNYYYTFTPHDFKSDNEIVGNRYLGFVYRKNNTDSDNNERYFVPAYNFMSLKFDEIYPYTLMDFTLDDKNSILDLE